LYDGNLNDDRNSTIKTAHNSEIRKLELANSALEDSEAASLEDAATADNGIYKKEYPSLPSTDEAQQSRDGKEVNWVLP
jgi:hypothetical protein